jgi:hypothetical protein
MKKYEITPRSIEGLWDCRGIFYRHAEQWFDFGEIPKGYNVWRFTGEMMISREDGQIRYVVEYNFMPEKMLLTLAGRELDYDGKPNSLVRETYRVDFPTPSEMHLYDRENVKPGEETLWFKFSRV